MSDYSNPEIDAKLALVEERLDHKFDRLLAEIKEGFLVIDKRFDLIDKDIYWLKIAVGTVIFPLFLALLTLFATLMSNLLGRH